MTDKICLSILIKQIIKITGDISLLEKDATSLVEWILYHISYLNWIKTIIVLSASPLLLLNRLSSTISIREGSSLQNHLI